MTQIKAHLMEKKNIATNCSQVTVPVSAGWTNKPFGHCAILKLFPSDRQDRTLLALSFSIWKQSCYEWKAKTFMQRCLQSTWRELGVAYVEFLIYADCEISWNQLAFSKTRNLNNFKTNQTIHVKPCRDVGWVILSLLSLWFIYGVQAIFAIIHVCWNRQKVYRIICWNQE